MSKNGISLPGASIASLLLLLTAGLIGADCGSTDHVAALPPERVASNPATEPQAETTSSLVRPSESGRYVVEIKAEKSPARRGDLHAWLVRVATVGGEWIRPTRLAFSGGMPQHGHGFETTPRVTDALADGWFRVGGVRFHMAGEWQIRVEFVGPAGPDVALFEVVAPH